MTDARETAHAGTLLRSWREHRRLSQQALSDRSTVSTRHLSRVETGRARPSASMLVQLSDHLDLPIRDRNRLLVLAGHAPRYDDRRLDDPALGPVLHSLRELLTAHLPYPALLLDDHWDVVEANAAVDALLSGCAADLLEPPINVVRLCLHPEGLAPRLRDVDRWAGLLWHQVSRRAERTNAPRLHRLVDEIRGFLGEIGSELPVSGPVVSLDLVDGDDTLRFFSTSTQLTTATDGALEGLHLETFLPADAHTRR
ncbi:helix-turn-helix transcriptional regulator [Isoptericola halotolerans]|uniref:helix-turn-helix domain-containing protein n=1 Tax=Isoptericola halotolerans TaxID=300560 RepID=UPI0038903909